MGGVRRRFGGNGVLDMGGIRNEMRLLRMTRV